MARREREAISEAARRAAYEKFMGYARNTLIFSMTQNGSIRLKRYALMLQTFDKVREARRALDRLCELLKDERPRRG